MLLKVIKINNKKDVEKYQQHVKDVFPVGSNINGHKIIGYEFIPTRRYITEKHSSDNYPTKHFFNSLKTCFKVICKNCGREHLATYQSLIRSNKCHSCQNKAEIPGKRSCTFKTNKSKNINECPFSHICFCNAPADRACTYVFHLYHKGKLYKKASKNINVLLQFRKDLLKNSKLYSKMIDEDLKFLLEHKEIYNKYKENYNYLFKYLEKETLIKYYKIEEENDN